MMSRSDAISLGLSSMTLSPAATAAAPATPTAAIGLTGIPPASSACYSQGQTSWAKLLSAGLNTQPRPVPSAAAWQQQVPTRRARQDDGSYGSMRSSVVAPPSYSHCTALSTAGFAGPPASKRCDNHRTLRVRRSHWVDRAHEDDIHGLQPISNDHDTGEGRFVSGSKDGNLHLWTDRGDHIRTLCQQGHPDYTRWLTALCPSKGNEEFAYGTRDGRVHVVDAGSSRRDNLHRCITGLPQRLLPGPCPALTSRGAEGRQRIINCKERNAQRITSLAYDSDGDRYFIGRPTGFTVLNASSITTGEPLDTVQTSSNDWVYCITPLSKDYSSLLVVTGTNLDVWKSTHDSDDASASANQQCRSMSSRRSCCWNRSERLVKAELRSDDNSKRKHRPFISAVTKLNVGNELYGISVFDGSIRVVDVTARRTVRCWREHSGRTWAVENLGDHNVFITGADDHSMKLWDVRCPASVHTIGNQIGRVSSLMRLSGSRWVSASCSDNIRARTAPKGELSFWDVRWLNSDIK